MLADTLARLAPLVPLERTLVLTNAGARRRDRDARAGAAPREPDRRAASRPERRRRWRGRAQLIAQRGARDDVMISVHADWAIGDAEGSARRCSPRPRRPSEQHALVTVGVVPVRPDPGFGYIQPGEPVGPAARRVARFVEKPDRARAEAMVRDGYLWNSGIFVWRAGDFLDEIAALTPEIAPHLARARRTTSRASSARSSSRSPSTSA